MSARLLICTFAVFPCVSFFFTDALHDSHGSLARSLSRPTSWDKLGKIRLKEPLRISKAAQFESDLLKTNEDTCIALESREIFQAFVHGGGKFVPPPPYKHHTFINLLGPFAKKLENLSFSKTF